MRPPQGFCVLEMQLQFKGLEGEIAEMVEFNQDEWIHGG